MLEKLQQELGTVIKTEGQRPNWQQLEQLPYLVSHHHQAMVRRGS